MEKYEIINWPSNSDRIELGPFGIINRKTLTDEKAEKLFKAKVPFIREKKAKATSKKDDSK
jgi:hypothetical protein